MKRKTKADKKMVGTEGDFKRTKLKVGKGPVKQLNQTDTSFRSKRIKMPTQSNVSGPSAEDEAAGAALNQRQQGLAELLPKVGHYSASVRKDALWGLRDLFGRHPQAIAPNLGRVLEAVLECTVDTDAQVREALRALLEPMLAAVPGRALEPFLPLIVAYLASATTAMDGDVRVGAVLTADVLLRAVPGLFAEHAVWALLPNYATLLATKSVASKQDYGALGKHGAKEEARQARNKEAKEVGRDRGKKAASSSMTGGISAKTVTVLEGLHRLLMAAEEAAGNSGRNNMSVSAAGACWKLLRASTDLWLEVAGLPLKFAASATEWTLMLSDIMRWSLQHLADHRGALVDHYAATGAASGAADAAGPGVTGGGGGGGRNRRPKKKSHLQSHISSQPGEGEVDVFQSWQVSVERLERVVFAGFPYESAASLAEAAALTNAAADRGGGGSGGASRAASSAGGGGKDRGGRRGGATEVPASRLVALNVAIARLAEPILGWHEPAKVGPGGGAGPSTNGSGGRQAVMSAASSSAPRKTVAEDAVLDVIFAYVPAALRGLAETIRQGAEMDKAAGKAAGKAAAGGKASGAKGTKRKDGVKKRSKPEQPDATDAGSGGSSDKQAAALTSASSLLQLLWTALPHMITYSPGGNGNGDDGDDDDDDEAVAPASVADALEAFTALYEAPSADSPVKLECLGFMRRILLAALEQGRGGSALALAPPVPGAAVPGSGGSAALLTIPSDMMEKWVVSLPKLAWQLGPRVPATTQAILTLLLDIARRQAPAPDHRQQQQQQQQQQKQQKQQRIAASVDDVCRQQARQCLAKIAPFFAAFFYTQAQPKKPKVRSQSSSSASGATDGAGGAGGDGDGTSVASRAKKQKKKAEQEPPAAAAAAAAVRHVFGPFLGLAPPAQRRAIDVMYHLPDLPRPLLRALVAVCNAPQATPALRRYVLRVLHHRRHDLGISMYLGVVASLLLDSPGGTHTAAARAVEEQQQQQQQQHPGRVVGSEASGSGGGGGSGDKAARIADAVDGARADVVQCVCEALARCVEPLVPSASRVAMAEAAAAATAAATGRGGWVAPVAGQASLGRPARWEGKACLDLLSPILTGAIQQPLVAAAAASVPLSPHLAHAVVAVVSMFLGNDAGAAAAAAAAAAGEGGLLTKLLPPKLRAALPALVSAIAVPAAAESSQGQQQQQQQQQHQQHQHQQNLSLKSGADEVRATAAFTLLGQSSKLVDEIVERASACVVERMQKGSDAESAAVGDDDAAVRAARLLHELLCRGYHDDRARGAWRDEKARDVLRAEEALGSAACPAALAGPLARLRSEMALREGRPKA
eukprot:g1019.t1